MSNSELNPEWVLSNSRQLENNPELTEIASRLWPRVRAHARKQLANQNADDSETLAAEVWESVLRSVSKTLARHHETTSTVLNLESYLFGAFLHRFNRALKRERKRQEIIEPLASTRELEQLPGARDWKSADGMERSLQVQEVMDSMDTWTRRVFAARLYGYTWKEIAELHELSESKAKLRFRYALRRLAARLGYGK
jgi:DNA-directed RNA polymerase specialized sigma24 family protein